MQTAQFIRSVRSQAASRLEAGTLASPAKLVEQVLTEYLAGTWGGYELTPEAVEEVLQIAEQQAEGRSPSRSKGVVFRPLHMLMETPASELLGIRAQALVAEVVDEARHEIMEKALEPVTLPVATALEAERWLRDEDQASSWDKAEWEELNALREELRSITTRIGRLDASARNLGDAGQGRITLPSPPEDDSPMGGARGAYRVARVTSCRGALPALAENTRLIVGATGVPAPSVTLHILTGERLQYAPVTMGSTHFATTLPGGHTLLRKEVQFVFRSPDIDQTDMLSLHRLLREQFSAGYTKSLGASDVELALLTWACLDEFSVPPTASFPYKSYGLSTVKLFETVRARLQDRGEESNDWRGPYQRFQRITDNLDRTISVIEAEDEEDFVP